MDQPFQGLRVVLTPGTHHAVLKADDGQIIRETVGPLMGTGTMEVLHHLDGTPRVPSESSEWVAFGVLTRGIHLWDREDFAPGSRMSCEMNFDTPSSPLASDPPTQFFVGYSMNDFQPVMATQLKRPFVRLESDVGESDMEDSEMEESFTDDLADLELQTVDKPIDRQAIIVHHTLSVPGNIAQIKGCLTFSNPRFVRWFGSSDLDDAFDDDRIAQSVSEHISSVWEGLFVGHKIDVVASSWPKVQLQPADHDYEPARWPDTRIPRAMPLLKRDGRAPKGFIYLIPYMSNMVYPPELYETLRTFVRKYTNDKFHATAMLFAVQLWFDITEDPRRQIEDINRRHELDMKVPHVSLAVFLAYFEHWLKAHEIMRCLEYIHPCRGITRMYYTDLMQDAVAYLIDPNDIDEFRVRQLVRQATIKRPEWPVNTRVPFLPSFATNSTMTVPGDLEGFRTPSKAEMALIGLPSIRVLGLPSMVAQRTSKCIIATPKILADLSFHGIETKLNNRLLKSLSDVREGSVTSQFAGFSTYGNVWDHDFKPNEDNNDAVRSSGNNGTGQGHGAMERRVAWLKRRGLCPENLTIGQDGLPYVPGEPLEDEEFVINALEAEDYYPLNP